MPSVLSTSVSSLVETIRRLNLCKERDPTIFEDNQRFRVVVETARYNMLYEICLAYGE